MLSDFTIITHEFPQREDIRIYAIGDLHLGSKEHMAKEWDAFCKRILDDDHGYVILVGDLINNCTRSSIGNTWDDNLSPREQKERMVRQLTPLKERILASVPGNHEFRSVRETEYNPSYDIAVNLGVQHLWRENIAFVRVRIGNHKYSGVQNPTYILTVTHGAGGGRKTGSAVNRAEDFGYILDGSDALILGHTHRPFVTQPCKISIDARNGRVSQKPFKVISVTSWMEYGGYAARKMLNPVSHAPQIITLCGTKKDISVEI